MIRNMIVLIVFAAACCSCSGKEDADLIRDLIRSAAELAEERQVGDLMDLTAQEFTALPGHHDALSVKGILFRAFMHYGVFKIHYPKPAVDLLPEDRGASATVYFLIVRKNQAIPGLKALYDDPGQWLKAAGDKADLYRLKLQLKKTGALWRVYRAHLEGFKGTRF